MEMNAKMENSGLRLNSEVILQEVAEVTESKEVANNAFANCSFQNIFGPSRLSVDSVCSCSRSISVSWLRMAVAATLKRSEGGSAVPTFYFGFNGIFVT